MAHCLEKRLGLEAGFRGRINRVPFYIRILTLPVALNFAIR